MSVADLAGTAFFLLLFYQATMGPSFLPGNDVADELARWVALLASSVIHSSLSLVSTLFSDWRCTVSSKFFNTQAPLISTEELVLLCHVHCALSRL